MVRSAAHLLGAALVSVLLLPALAAAPDLPNYQIGDTAAADIAAPAGFTIIDLDATETLRRQVAALAPVYFQSRPQTAAEVEAAFRSSFAAAREKFLAALENHFATNRLDAAAVAGEPFQQFCQRYRPGQKVFPADRALLAAWAQGEPDAALAGELAAKLREAAARHICPLNLPAELRSSPQVRLLTAAAPDLAAAARAAVEIPRAQLIPLGRARTNLLAAFPAAQQPMAKFLAGLLKTNCAPEIELTRQSRAQQAEAAISAAQYAAGQLIVRRGEVITAKTKAALDKAGKLLAARAAAEQELAAQQLAARKIAAGKIAATQPSAPPNPWPWLAIVVVAPLAGLILWRQIRRQRAPSLLPMRFNGIVDSETVLPDDASEWQRRAFLAEQRAERATAIVRKGLVGQLARLLTNDLVKKLVSQRTDLIAGQQQAGDDIELLAARLEKLEGAPPKGYYEQRVAELEKELALKSAENRALLEARIEIARRQMAEAQRRVDWN